MKLMHTPRIDARYWAAITLASVFGTNLGDFYAHESGLGIVKGLGVLAFFTAVVFAIEVFDSARHEAYYWLVIILIRTGATNIADYLAFRVRVPPAILVSVLILLLIVFGWGTRNKRDVLSTLPKTNPAYWCAMLTAGVFGTVVGDICEHAIGEGVAAIALTAILAVALFAGRARVAQIIALYWVTVAVARTAGTALGDWLAENRALHIGLPLSTLLSGISFVAVLLFWQSRSKFTPAPLDSHQLIS